MKEVIAIIRMDKINKTKEALVEAGINSIHVKDVLGRGKGYIENKATGKPKYEDIDPSYVMVGRLVPKRKISIILPSRDVQKAVKVIIQVNQTGESGDGKIFVLPVMESIRVRDGQSGDETLDQ
ncbi:MAG: P-II family nitrogen regulator [Planctomycetaceae bacterium]|jgi:nitrogen regulatory protein PII 2|nr:P-II family nitrogen regulator [Planctomycetaceae bacterium]